MSAEARQQRVRATVRQRRVRSFRENTIGLVLLAAFLVGFYFFLIATSGGQR